MNFDRDFMRLDPFAGREPWNLPDPEPEPPQCCAQCGATVPDEDAEIAVTHYYHVLCDHCLVTNAEACGDWCDASIAATLRITHHHTHDTQGAGYF